jgi:hypothetical protein
VAPAVVVVLSQEFTSKQYPMEELQLVLQWQQQGSAAKLLPVFHGITYEEVISIIKQYQQALEGSLEVQWAKDLSLLCDITGARSDQVRFRPKQHADRCKIIVQHHIILHTTMLELPST